MASLTCPFCGSSMPTQRGWMQTAIATLSPSPAVPDMATQVRCPSCGRVSAASDLRHAVADRLATHARVLLVLVVVALAWAFIELWRR